MEKSRAFFEKLQEIHEERSRLLDVLRRTDELAVGTVQRLKRRCYNPRCGNCADGPSHEQVVFSFKKGARRTSAFIRRADEERFEKAGANYREFRSAVQALRALHRQEMELLGRLKEARAIEPPAKEPGDD
jgi:hypothetical protein